MRKWWNSFFMTKEQKEQQIMDMQALKKIKNFWGKYSYDESVGTNDRVKLMQCGSCVQDAVANINAKMKIPAFRFADWTLKYCADAKIANNCIGVEGACLPLARYISSPTVDLCNKLRETPELFSLNYTCNGTEIVPRSRLYLNGKEVLQVKTNRTWNTANYSFNNIESLLFGYYISEWSKWNESNTKQLERDNITRLLGGE